MEALSSVCLYFLIDIRLTGDETGGEVNCSPLEEKEGEMLLGVRKREGPGQVASSTEGAHELRGC